MRRLPVLLLALALLSLVVALPHPTQAPDPVWGPIQEISSDRRIENQRYAAVAVGAGVHAVWSDLRDRDYDLYHRSSDGTTWGAITELSTDGRDEYQWFGDVAVEGSLAHVVWQDQVGGDWDIMYRRFDGSSWGPIAEVSVDVGSEAQNFPKVAAGGGNVYLVWQDGRDGDWDIYFRMWDGQWGAAQQVSVDAGTEAQQSPALAADGGVVHVVWQDRGSGDWDVRYRRFDGSSWGTIQTVAGGPADQTEAEVAALGGRVHVVWQDTAGGDRDIWYREWTGASWAPPVELSQDAGAEFQRLPVVAAETNRVHVGWIDYRDGDGDYVYRYREGGVWSARVGVSVDVGNEAQWEPEIAAEPGRVHFVWEDPRDGDLDIYYRTATFAASSDNQAPEVRDARIDGQPARTYPLSGLPATVALTATVDDRATGGSPIGGANYTTPTATSFPGIPMAAADGAFDGPLEDVRATPAPPRTKGTYAYCVRGWDNVGNANPTPSCASLTVVDDVPPEVRSVRLDGQATLTVSLGTASVLLTATIDDANRGGSRIQGANYTVGVRAWPGTALDPTDGAWDSPTEDGRKSVATATWPAGTYTLCAYGSDDVPNPNTAGACATLVLAADAIPPRIGALTVDGQASVTYPISSRPATVRVRAQLDDTATGGSRIAGGNATVGVRAWPGTPLAAEDGAFDTPTEWAIADVPTPSAAGVHDVCAYGWDEYLNANLTGRCATVTIVDDLPPEVPSILLDGVASKTVPRGASVRVRVLVDDEPAGGSAVAGANYTVGVRAWPGTPLAAEDGAFDGTREWTMGTLATGPLLPGAYVICGYGRDAAGNANFTGRCADLSVSADTLPPRVSDVRIAGQTDAVFALSSLPAALTLTALADDTATGGSLIAGANYTFGPPGWPGLAMEALDGTLDGPLEEVTATFVPPSAVGLWTVYAFAWDASGNANATLGAFATLTILDDLPPDVRDVRLDGQTTRTVPAGTATVLLTATIDDANRGGSRIQGANYTLGPRAWPGVPLAPADGAWDGPTEGGRAVIDVAAWAPGTYVLCVYGSDGESNGNTTGACAGLVLTAPATNAPPTVTGVTATPSPARTGSTVLVHASVEDDGTVAGVWAQVLDPAGETANLTMAYADGRWEASWIAGAAGSYAIRVWAVDDGGLWGTGEGSLQVAADETPVPVELNLKPAVAAVFAAAILLIAWRRPARRRLAIPFALAELGTGAASLAVPLLRIPPPLGAGTAIDALLLVLGLVVPLWLARRLRGPDGEKR